MSRRLLYIVNPISGTANKASVKETIIARTEATGIDYAIYPSVANADYSFLYPVIEEQGFTDVIIAGGDGTINQAINSLKHLDVQFGIIPCGSGNGLAFSAGIPKNVDKALKIVFTGTAIPTDGFLINDQFACMLVGLGLDAQVAHDFANDPNRGLTTYIKQTIKNFITAKVYPFTLLVGDKELNTDAFFISIANSNQFGNHFTIAPKASLSDGLLDVVIMTRQNKLAMLLRAAFQITGFYDVKEVGKVNEKADLIYFQTDAITILNPESAPMHIDGDPVETERVLNIKLLPRCFKLIYPA